MQFISGARGALCGDRVWVLRGANSILAVYKYGGELIKVRSNNSAYLVKILILHAVKENEKVNGTSKGRLQSIRNEVLSRVWQDRT